MQNKQPTRNAAQCDSALYTHIRTARKSTTRQSLERTPVGRDTDSRVGWCSGGKGSNERTFPIIVRMAGANRRSLALASPSACADAVKHEGDHLIWPCSISVCVFCRLDRSLVTPRVFRNRHSRTYVQEAQAATRGSPIMVVGGRAFPCRRTSRSTARLCGARKGSCQLLLGY